MPFRGEGKDEMSKSIKQMMKLLVAGLFGLLVFCVVSPQTVSATELYFDEEGNLYFHTRDRRAFGSVSYMTLGWTIKRYDMPMDAPGQQYVIVNKVNYKPDEIDPTDSNYVLSYFRSDKDEILNAVRSESEEWYQQLYQYGDKVYIDSVMTVCVNGKPLGTLYSGGNYTGEVYFTYDTFVVARGWSSPAVIATHFDMEVVFPQLKAAQTTTYTVKKTSEEPFESNPMAAFTMGAGRYGAETYSLADGVPSGENLYLRGVLASTIYRLWTTKVTAVMTQTIAVPCKYTIKWTDYDGVSQVEERTVTRYYDVSVEYEYYTYQDMDVYRLANMELTGSLWGEDGRTISVMTYTPTVSVTRYSQPSDYVVFCAKQAVATVDGGVLKGTKKGIKPSIPDEDYSAQARASVKTIAVRNDKVMVDGVAVMGNTVGINAPEIPSVDNLALNFTIHAGSLTIPTETLNGIYDDMELTYKYVSEEGEVKEKTVSTLPSVLVHTPVVCQAYVDSSIELDGGGQSDTYICLGQQFDIRFDDTGVHRDILGYGLRSYLPYVGTRRVCCPFAVEYQGARYEAGTWIDVDKSTLNLLVCEDVPVGSYIIVLQNWAYNAPSYDDGYLQDMANLSVDRYGAACTLQVEVVGWRADLQVSGTH